MGSKNLKDIRRVLADKSNKVLFMYRKHCAPAVQAGQVSPPGLGVYRELTSTAHLAGRVQTITAVHALHDEVQAVER